jgi:hypothetical protein
MSRVATFLSAITAALLANVVGFYVLDHNLKVGVYSPESDTIIIPIIENAILSVLMIILLAASASCREQGRWLRWLGVLPGLLAAFLAVIAVLRWSIPDHYWVAIAFSPLVVVLYANIHLSVRGLASNYSLQARLP